MGFDRSLQELHPGLAMNAAHGVVYKNGNWREIRVMAADSAERHPVLNVMGDILIEGLADENAHVSRTYKRGLRDGVLASMSALSEYAILESLAVTLPSANIDMRIGKNS